MPIGIPVFLHRLRVAVEKIRRGSDDRNVDREEKTASRGYDSPVIG